ncbi:uncharacterized protein LOC114874897 isoform X1 [Osmia bicornis bicornis]|uniref:uncharacterized protein LOC114874897 isoform X1 n=1 Tax=Osmia bicornis bicornis TaxID=1437191 RepID=UPI001EAEBB04|nr:uncharacterized protein LOC114874897 isoform X1 [Osmia bicornis bicornis]
MLRKYHVCLPFEEHQNWIKRRASLTEDTCLPGRCNDACRGTVRRVRANLKPEAPLSALLLTNNEIERFLRGRKHDQTASCFIDRQDRKYSFLRLKTSTIVNPFATSLRTFFRVSVKVGNS